MTNLREVDAVRRTDFPIFGQTCFATLNRGLKIEPAWHQEAIAHKLTQCRSGEETRLIINAPPRSGKSTLASVALPAFVMGHNPSARFICVSHSEQLASKQSRDFKNILDADWYRRIFPRTIATKCTEEMFETTQGGARLSTSIGASVTGLGGGYIIIDDPMKPDEALSESARERCNRYFRETLFSRLDNKATGCIILVMQRLHEDDPSGHLLAAGGWSSLTLPSIATSDEVFDLGNGRSHRRKVGEPLDPIREPLKVLEDVRRSVGSTTFEAQYQQRPVPQAGNMVVKDWLKSFKHEPRRENAIVAQSWDTALKGNAANDYSVCTTWLQRNGEHYLIDVFRQKLDFPHLIKSVISQHDKFTPDALLIEDHGSGTSLIQQLRSQHGIYAIPRRSKDDKQTRLSIVSNMFEAGQVFFPEERPWLTELLHELLGFPQTRHDDQVDSITQYLIWARDRSSGTLFEADFGHSDAVPSAEDIAYRMLHLAR